MASAGEANAKGAVAATVFNKARRLTGNIGRRPPAVRGEYQCFHRTKGVAVWHAIPRPAQAIYFLGGVERVRRIAIPFVGIMPAYDSALVAVPI